MIARDKFKIGQQVKLTAYGIKAFRHNRAKVPYNEELRGYVHGFGRNASAVIIHREGTETPDAFHMDYWEPLNADE